MIPYIMWPFRCPWCNTMGLKGRMDNYVIYQRHCIKCGKRSTNVASQ